jgi:hypothetical protein
VFVRDGEFETVFLPGTLAGEAEIKITATNPQIPQTTTTIDILPNEAAKIKIKEMPAQLIEGGDYFPVSAVLVDEYGNEITDQNFDIDWEIQGGSIQDPEQNQEQNQQKGLVKIGIRPDSTNPVQLTARSTSVQTETQIQLETLETPVLKAIQQEKQIIAGQKDPLTIVLQAQTKTGQLLNIDTPVELVVDDVDLGIVPKTVELQNGRTQFKIFPGTKAGIFTLKMYALGFDVRPLQIKILPEKAEKLELTLSKKSLDKQENTTAWLAVEAIDKYGNRDTNFNQSVSLSFNDVYIPSNGELQDLTDEWDAIGFSESQKQFIVNRKKNPDRKSPPSDPELLTIDKGQSLRLRNGYGESKVSVVQKTGTVHLVAKANNIAAGLLKFDVTNTIRLERIHSWQPTALFSLLTGFQGAFVPHTPSLGNAFLFLGQNQAVGTSISDPKGKKQKGYIHTDGGFDGDLIFQFQEAPTLQFRHQDTNVAEIRFQYENKPPFVIQTQSNAYMSEGISLYPEPGISFVRDDNTVWLDDRPLFRITNQGGIQPLESELIIQNTNKNIFEWSLLLEDDRIATLTYTLKDPNPKVVQNFYSNEWGGVLVKPDFFEVKAEKGFTGETTESPLGILFYSEKEWASANEKLGTSKQSIEDAWETENIGWDKDFKPLVHMAAGNMIGMATQWGASPDFILLGDPTLSIQTANESSKIGLTKDMGTQITKDPDGPMDDIFVYDIDGDETKEILTVGGNEIKILYRDALAPDRYFSGGSLIKFADGAKGVVVFDNNQDGFADILQLNDAGDLFIHKNNEGQFQKIPLSEYLAESGQTWNEEVPIKQMGNGRFDNDNFEDVVLLDEEQCLIYLHGQKNGFKTPQKADCLTPSFQDFSEEYIVSENQDPYASLFDPDPLTVLRGFKVSFDGITQTASQTEELKTYQTPLTPFAPIDKNGFVNGKFTLTSQNRSRSALKPEDGIQATFEVSAEGGISKFHFIAPTIDGMELVPDTIECTGCLQEIEEKQTTPQGIFWIEAGSIESQTSFTWQMKMTELPELEWQIEGNGSRGTDTLQIPWEAENQKQIITYTANSSGNLTRQIEAYEEPETVTEESFFGNKTNQEVKEELMKPLAQDSDGDGYPDMYDDPGVFEATDFRTAEINTTLEDSVQEAQDEKQPKSCPPNQSGGLPMVPKTFLAPGPDTNYIPPMSFPGAFQMGTPVSWAPPPPASPTPQVAAFRFYVMPTTNGKVGIGGCSGSYFTNMVPPVWTPTCYSKVPSDIEPICMGSEESSSEKGNKNLFSGNKNLSKFMPRLGGEGNKQIAGADIITTFTQDQYREFSNVKFPTVKFKRPKFDMDIGGDVLREASHPSPVASTASPMQLWAQNINEWLRVSVISKPASTQSTQDDSESLPNKDELIAQSPYLKTKAPTITIPYIKITKNEKEAYEKAFKQYEEEYTEWDIEMTKRIQRFEQEIPKSETRKFRRI